MSALFAVLCVPGMILDSDVLVPEMMYRDLFVNHTALNGWNFSSALFLFPDWGVYFLVRSITAKLSWVFLGYGTLQVWAFYWIFRRIWRAEALGLFLLWALLFFLIFPPEWMVFLWPVFHGGSMITGLLFAQWYLKRPNFRLGEGACFAVLGALVLVSDLFFGLQTLLPLGVLSVVRWWQKERSGIALEPGSQPLAKPHGGTVGREGQRAFGLPEPRRWSAAAFFMRRWPVAYPVYQSPGDASSFPPDNAVRALGALARVSDLFFGLPALLPPYVRSVLPLRRKGQPLATLIRQAGLGVGTAVLAFVFSKVIFGLMHTKPLNFTYIQYVFHPEKALDIAKYLLGFRVGFPLIVFAIWKGWRDRKEVPLYSWFLVSLPINLLVVLLADLWLDQLTVRYFLLFPVFVCLVLARQLLGWLGSGRAALRASAAGLVLLAVVCALPNARAYVKRWPDRSIFAQPYPAEVACFDQWESRYGLKDGIADFWLAKTIPLFSRTHPNLVPMRDEAKEFKWLNNSRWYDGVQSRRYILRDQHDGRPKIAAVLARWGEPVKKDFCGTFELWLYDKNLNEGF